MGILGTKIMNIFLVFRNTSQTAFQKIIFNYKAASNGSHHTWHQIHLTVTIGILLWEIFAFDCFKFFLRCLNIFPFWKARLVCRSDSSRPRGLRNALADYISQGAPRARRQEVAGASPASTPRRRGSIRGLGASLSFRAGCRCGARRVHVRSERRYSWPSSTRAPGLTESALRWTPTPLSRPCGAPWTQPCVRPRSASSMK